MIEEKKISLILGTHAHIPSGSSQEEFEQAYENIMRPFVSNLYKYSNVQAVLHYSGVLLYWVERTHPEFFMLIEDMAARKQIEILSGGFYEPMFPIIPLQDRIGQIELLTTYLRRHFGKRPLGCWIPCMAWEQNIVSALAASDMNYTFLSLEQFSQAGLSVNDLFSPCITEDQGRIINVFPVSLDMETELESKSFSQVFIELKKKLSEELGNSGDENRLISVFPKKVSSNPKEAPDTVWNRFFEEISLSEDFVETVLPSKVLKNKKPLKKASFQNSSSYRASCNSEFSPRRFLIDNCNASGIYSKMIFTNVLISQLKGDKDRKQNAREELWKAQDSCLFSPGDGTIRNELRKSAYSSLLRAEQLSREKGRFVSSLIQYDFDFNGKMEYLFQDAKINCYIQLTGASIFELDYLPKEWNYLDCGSLKIDGKCSRRTSFADVLLPPDTIVKDLEKDFSKNSRLCFNEQYEALEQDRKGKSCFKLSAVNGDMPFGSIEINKCYSLKKDVLTVSYSLNNTGKESGQQAAAQQAAVSFCFVPKIDFSFAGEGEEFVRFYSVESAEKDIPADRQLENTSNLKILDVKNEMQIILSSAIPFFGCLLPVYDSGHYQATRILPLFSISLEAGESWNNEFSLKFSH